MWRSGRLDRAARTTQSCDSRQICAPHGKGIDMPDGSPLSPLAVHIHVVAIGLAAAGMCWGALLAGLSRRHWFLRASALCLPLLLLLPIRAYEPLVLLFPLVIALAATAAALRSQWERGLTVQGTQRAEPETNGRPQRWRISLSDTLLAMTVIGAILAILAQLPWRNLNLSWWGLLFDAAVFYSLSVVCLCLVGLRGGLFWAVPLFLCVSTGIVFESTYGDGLQALYLMGVTNPQQSNWFPIGEYYLLFVTLLVVGLWLVRWCASSPDAQVWVWRQRLVGGVVGVLAMPAVALYLAMFVGPTAPAAPRIRNNSLPQLVDVAKELQTLGVGELTLLELAQIYPNGNYEQEVEALYDRALHLAKHPGSVSLDASLQSNEHSLSAQEAQVMLLRSLSRRWSREADQSYRGGDVRRATELDLGILRLGNHLSRGGIRLHVQAAQAIKREGLSHLTMLRDQMPADLIPVVINVLEQLESGEENPQLTYVRDLYWTDIAHGWRHRLESVVQRLLRLPSTETAAIQVLKQPMARETAHRRLLGTELALRHYREEHGRYPESLVELVPTRLDLVPVDPYTEQPLVYRPEEHGFVLYSTGPDARDDGGNFSRFGNDPLRFGYDWNLETIARVGWRPMRGRGMGATYSSAGRRTPARWAPPWGQGERSWRRSMRANRQDES